MTRLLAVVLVVGGAAACGADGGETGVYVATVEDGAPGWIGAPAGAPIWSPVGDAIAWGSEDGLFVHDRASGTTRAVTEQPVAGRPAWEPDSTAIAFVDRDRMSLEVVDPATGAARFSIAIENPDASRPPLAVVSVGGPAWSPDGGRIAFSCWDGAGDEICVVDGDGGNRRQLTDIETAAGANRPADSAPAIANTGRPSWSPDGRLLAVAVYPERRGAPAGVFAIDPEAGEARKLAALVPSSEIYWTPEGDAVVYSATVEGRSDAYRVPIDGGEALNLSAALPGGARSPALSPEGARLAVASDGEIVSIDLQSGTTLSIGSVLGDDHPAWSPDGDQVAFVAAPDVIRGYGSTQ